jgi:hypothetical protein
MHNRIFIVTILTIITNIVIFNDQLNTASSDDAKSIPPDYRGGYEVGIMQGIQDQRSGKGHNDSCPPENYGILWCIGYEIGYNKGYYDNSDTLEGK